MKVLLAIDGSSYSAEAVGEVAARMWSPETMVRVLTAVEPVTPPTTEIWYDADALEHTRQEMIERGERLVAGVAKGLHAAGLAVETAVRDGDPRTVIVDEAKEWSVDLIVMGSHGYTGLARLLLGSVAHSVVSHAPCSVEVVRKKQAEEV